MAKVTKRVLGEYRGKIGNIVSKVRDGKQYFAARPENYRMSKEPHEVEKRNRFKVNGQFAKAVRMNEVLFRVWNKADVKANNAYNKISKMNFKLCEPDRPSVKNIITPPGFTLPVNSVQTFADRVEIEIAPFELQSVETKIILILYVCFYEPEEDIPYYELSRIVNYEYVDPEFVFKYSSRDKKLSEVYKHKIIFLAAVTEDAEGNIVRWSSTAGREI